MRFFLERAREKSTWAGVATLAAAVGIGMDPDTFGAARDFVTGGAALALMLMREAPKS